MSCLNRGVWPLALDVHVEDLIGRLSEVSDELPWNAYIKVIIFILCLITFLCEALKPGTGLIFQVLFNIYNAPPDRIVNRMHLKSKVHVFLILHVQQHFTCLYIQFFHLELIVGLGQDLCCQFCSDVL